MRLDNDGRPRRVVGKRFAAALFWLATTLLPLPTLAFLPPSRPRPSWPLHVPGVSSLPSSSSSSATTLGLSIDDSWDEVATRMSQAGTKIQWSTIEKQLAALHWKEFLSEDWFRGILAAATDLQRYLAALPAALQVSLVCLPLAAAALAALYQCSVPPDNYRAGKNPYPRGQYDPIQARVYYNEQHQLLVAQRVAQLLRLSNRFLVRLALDKYLWRKEEENRPQRAQELLELITQLGPTAIKVGQALSVRPDLIPTEYATALALLQDQVPPFDGARAKAVLQQQLGLERYSRLHDLGLEKNGGPVASASIGQVYRGYVDNSDGQQTPVAVKVQRPDVLAEIALDLHIVREFAPIYQKLTGSATDLQSLASEWGRVFIGELDYRAEARATSRFTTAMRQRGLDAVCAPTVVPEFSTEQVLVTEWVDGTRLEQSDAADVPRLCSVALNAYLVMLLELQSLHCDPHPGNLLRTSTGRLCILDFGMTLQIDPNLQYSLLEFVAHLTAEDFDELPEDLVRLGFLKPEKLDFARRSGVLEPLKYFFRQAGKGGGAKGVRTRVFDEYRTKYPGLTDDELRVEMRAEMKQNLADIVERESVATGITMEVEELQRRNRDAFQIPEWFLYTSRAFLTLEGVSLQANEDYSIIKSCFPYVSKRLVGDDDPRARKALRDLIYGASDAVDVDRLADLVEGFSSYTTTTRTLYREVGTLDKDANDVDGEPDREKKLSETESAITLVKDSADILFAPGGNLVQNLLVEESALAASAQFKDSLRDTLVDGPQRFRDSLPLGVGSFLPPLPFEEQVAPFVQKSEQEKKAQALADKISKLVLSQQNPSNGIEGRMSPVNGVDTDPTTAFVQKLRELDPEQAALTLKEIRENLPRYAPLVGQLGRKGVSTLLKTANMNIERTLGELEQSGEDPDPAFRATVKGLSSVAERGAKALTPQDDELASSSRQR